MGDHGPPVLSGGLRALRHGMLATGLVLAVCAVLAVLCLLTLRSASGVIASADERAVGEIVRVDGDSAVVRWTPAGGTERTTDVDLAVPPPAAGTRTELAYDPATGVVLIPGSEVLAEADRALGGVVSVAVVAAGVLALGSWRWWRAARAARGAPREAPVRRVAVQSGLVTRSWLESESSPQWWVPVYFDPALVTLPSPAPAVVHGEPSPRRWVAVDAGGVRLYPSGPVTRREPRGRRSDNPRSAGSDAARRAEQAQRLTQQLRADLVLVVPAPFVGLFWVFLGGGGTATWAGATVLVAALGLWWAAVRGSDPS